MSARLLRRVLKEQDEHRLTSSNPHPDDADDLSDSPPADSPSTNLFDLLHDDQGVEAAVGIFGEVGIAGKVDGEKFGEGGDWRRDLAGKGRRLKVFGIGGGEGESGDEEEGSCYGACRLRRQLPSPELASIRYVKYGGMNEILKFWVLDV